jgi:hypothetical protein
VQSTLVREGEGARWEEQGLLAGGEAGRHARWAARSLGRSRAAHSPVEEHGTTGGGAGRLARGEGSWTESSPGMELGRRSPVEERGLAE